MIINFYDKQFTPLTNNASLNVSKYEIDKRAIDYDDFTATCEAYTQNINPTFVTLSDDRGRYVYGAFAGVPSVDKNNQTQLQASDLKTIFNNEMVVAFSTYTTLYQYFNALFSLFDSKVNQSSFTIEYNLNEIMDVAISNLIPSTEEKKYNIWNECIVNYLKYYDLYMETKLDIKNKKIIYLIKKINNKQIPLHLWEYGINNYGKYIADVNEARAIVKYSTGEIENKYILLANNTITNDLTLRDIYPIKIKCFYQNIDSSDYTDKLKETIQQALTELVNARYNESITISTNNRQDLEDADFSTSFNIYTSKGIFYKTLPLGTIKIYNDKPKDLVIGYKPDSILFYFK